MNALVVGAAPVSGCEDYYRALLNDADLLVACDAAGEWCVSLGRVPDVVVGDFDSANSDAQGRLRSAGAEVLEFPPEKDETDLDLGLMVCAERGADVVTICAAFAGRLDHACAALGSALRFGGLLALVYRDPGFEGRVLAHPTRPAVMVRCEVGTTVSIVALTPCSGVTTEGLRYPLQGDSLQPLASLGVSNLAAASRVCVRAEVGTLVVFVLEGV